MARRAIPALPTFQKVVKIESRKMYRIACLHAVEESAEMPTQNTREKLLDVAQDLIQRRGLNAMSFQDLSDSVGIRKASVHHHFSSKAEMVDALLARYLEQFDELLTPILSSRATGKTMLRRYCDLFVKTLDLAGNDKGCLCGMLMAELLSLDESGQKKVRDFLHSNSSAVESILTRGAQDGSLKSNPSNKVTARMVLATLEGGLLVARCDGGPKHLSDIASRLIQLLAA
jgi:TetR/AcrR family transcriptional repressor of nem operon